MAKIHFVPINLLIFGFLVSSAHTFMDSPHDLLVFCRDRIDIESCAHTHLDTSLSLYDIFDTMTTNVSILSEMCENQTLRLFPCIGPCALEFRASVFGYLDHVCTFLRWMEWEEECWTEQWALEARQCYREIYPRHRTENPYHGLYPVPYRVYDRASIDRLCFPTASVGLPSKCSWYQTWIFQKLLPHYYELHGYPDGFEHISDYIGFPGL